MDTDRILPALPHIEEVFDVQFDTSNLIVKAYERAMYGYIDGLASWGTYPIRYVPAKPHIWIPKLTLPQAVAAGVAAAVIKNPEVTRRFWAGWLK